VVQGNAIPTRSLIEPGTDQVSETEITVYTSGEAVEVSAPIEVDLEFHSVVDGKYRLELFGHDGRLLFRQLWALPGNPGTPAQKSLSVNFEIPGTQEAGRLVFTILDRQGRYQAVDSLDFTMLSAAIKNRQLALKNPDYLSIQSPAPESQLSGGTVLVSGQLKGNAELPLKVLLVAESGQVVGQRVAALRSVESEPGTWQYLADVPYSIHEKTSVRLQVIQSGEPTSETRLLASVLVDLTP